MPGIGGIIGIFYNIRWILQELGDSISSLDFTTPGDDFLSGNFEYLYDFHFLRVPMKVRKL